MNITSNAKPIINEILDDNKGKFLRIYMAGVGWGGPRLGMALDEHQQTDKKYNLNGIEIIISQQDQKIINGFTIDYIDNYNGKGLVINSSGSC